MICNIEITYLINLNKKLLVFFCFLLTSVIYSQSDSLTILTFDFNDQQIKENDNKVFPKSVGVSLTNDRFGNEKSALYIHGHNSSYLNLGTSNLLKSTKITISIWVYIERRIFTGKGYDNNPILILNNCEGDDFTNAFAISYECYNNRFAINSTKDSTKEVTILSTKPISFNKWYNLVFLCDSNYLSFYINGELQGKSAKNFQTKFLQTDSLMIGHSASKKNERFTQGIFDDIKIFHKILAEDEIMELYNAPNPNKLMNYVSEFLK